MYNVLNPPWCTSRCDNSENIQNVKASLNVLNLSYVAVFSETNTWINGLQQCHYLLRYQHVWVEHRFEASLDRRHVVREAAGERRRDSAELERCDTTGEAWNLKSTMSGRSGGENQVAEALGWKRKQMHHWHITTLHTRTPNVDHSSTENSPKHISTCLKTSVWVCTFDWLTVTCEILNNKHIFLKKMYIKSVFKINSSV